MMSQLALLSLTFTAGAFGAVFNSITVWFFGKQGISQKLGAQLAPPFTLPWLYQRMVWGGLWGLFFMLPIAQNGSYCVQGALVSIPPTLYQLFVVFPQTGKGMGGLTLGRTTPLLVVFFNLIWGIAAAFWIHQALL